MGTQTAEEIKKNMTDTLGDKFGSFLYVIYNEINWLSFKWSEYCQLFAIEETRIELLNKSAPSFFFLVQKTLIDSIILEITKLTDPIESCNKKNITLKAIPNYIDDEIFKNEIQNEIDNLTNKIQFLRNKRNQMISHMDFEYYLGPKKATTTELVTKNEIDTAIKNLYSIYEKIEKFYFNTRTSQKIQYKQGAVSLLRLIEYGIQFRQEAMEKKKQDEYYILNNPSKM